jgi:hypothetical protein
MFNQLPFLAIFADWMRLRSLLYATESRRWHLRKAAASQRTRRRAQRAQCARRFPYDVGIPDRRRLGGEGQRGAKVGIGRDGDGSMRGRGSAHWTIFYLVGERPDSRDSLGLCMSRTSQ